MEPISLSSKFRVVCLIVALVTALALATPVQAEGETPGEAPAATETPPPEGSGAAAVEEAQPTDAQPTEAPPAEDAPFDPPAADEAPALEAAPPVEAVPELSEVVEQLDQSGAVLLDPSGAEMPLASDQAAQLLDTSDPWFVSVGKKYRFLEPVGACGIFSDWFYCEDGLANPLQRALNYIKDHATIPDDKRIYLEAGTFKSDEILVDGSSASIAKLTGIIGAGSGQTVFSEISAFSILNMPGPFTLSGMTIQRESGTAKPVINFDNIGGTIVLKDLVIYNATSEGGLRIEHTRGSVLIDDFTVNFSHSNGAVIDNTAGSGNVTIRNSEFIASGGSNLLVYSNGSVLLDGVATVNSSVNGASITAQKGVTVKNSRFSGSTNGAGLEITENSAGNMNLDWVYAQFNRYGVMVYTKNGSITAKNITTRDNTYRGLVLDTCVWDGVKCAGNPLSGNITLINSDHNQAADYPQVGIYALGAVSISNIQVQNGDSSGLLIDNSSAATAKPVTISNANLVHNKATNLWIYSKGLITLDGVLAAYSTVGSGMYVMNTYGTAGVVIKGTSGTSGAIWNNQDGLTLQTNGPVTITALDASNNLTLYGAYISAGGKVTLSGTAAAPLNFSSNHTFGLKITTPGEINLAYVQALGNLSGSGIILKNESGTAGVNIKFTKSSGNQGGSGLKVSSNGAITLTSVIANNNGVNGASLDNSGAVKPITLNGSASAPNTFNGNQETGLELYTQGSVILKEVSAAGNSATVRTAEFGKYYQDALYNSEPDNWLFYGANDYKIIISVHSDFFYPEIALYDPVGITPLATSGPSGYDNSLHYKLSSGSGYYFFKISGGELGGYEVKLTREGVPYDGSLRQDSNVYGLYIDNRSLSNPSASVTMINTGASSGDFRGNGARGLNIFTIKNLAITKADSSYGGAGGAILTCTNGPITLKEFRSNFNPSSGAVVSALTSISVSGGAAIGNLGIGLDLYANGTITVTGSPSGSPFYFSDNSDNGLNVLTSGAVNLSNLVAGNNYRGVNVGSWGNVTITNALATYNNLQGIYVDTRGTITLKNVSTYNNFLSGIELINNSLDLNRGVSVTNLRLERDTGNGLRILTNGPILLNNVSAYTIYSGDCVYLKNDTASSNAGVTYTGGWVDTCGQTGVNILSKGAVTLTNLESDNPNWHGISIFNKESPLNAKVTLTNIGVKNALHGSGLQVITNGPILITNIKAIWNVGGQGIFLLNDTSPINAGVTIKASGGQINEIFRAGVNGLKIQTNGPVVLDQVYSENSINGSGAVIQTGSNLTITNSSFNSNYAYGLYAEVSGALVINNVSASYNTNNDGLRVIMSSDKPAAVTRATFISNPKGYGLCLLTKGATTLNKITANRNNSGAYIFNSNTTTAYPVTITNSMGGNEFNGNTAGTGLQVYNYGPINLKGITAKDNKNQGIRVVSWNQGGAAHVTADQITVTGNQNTGLSIENYTTGPTTALGTITVTNSLAFDNGSGFIGDGIYLYTNGNVAVKNTAAVGNHNNGLEIDVNLGVSLVVLSNVIYAGNDVNFAPDNPPNLYIH